MVSRIITHDLIVRRDFLLRTVPISLSLNAGYSSENVLCIDNSLPASYLLTSCPNGFSSTVQNTSGVCSITTSDNKTDLLLRAKELISGLHQFDCSTSDSTKPVIFSSTSVIIGKPSLCVWYLDIIDSTWSL